MIISDEQYAEALKTIYQYRTERGMDFYLPINTDKMHNFTLADFKLWRAMQKALENDTDRTH